MIRRSRAIALAIALLIGFLYITSRHGASHPRDLSSIRSSDSETEAQLHAILKEPPGKWDPEEDKFVGQQPPAAAHPQVPGEQPNVAGKSGSDNIKKDNVPEAGPGAAAVKEPLDEDKARPIAGGLHNQPGIGDAAKAAGQLHLGGLDSPEPVPYDAAQDLKQILTQSPIIIFSKRHCPHSKDAKRILLESHYIYPPPYVVELDIHPHGPELQAHLGKVTGRRTVPNVLVDGVSIGGGDEMRAMEGNQAVASTLLGLLKGKITVDGKSSD